MGKYVLRLANLNPEKILQRYGLWEPDDKYEIIDELYVEPTTDILQDKSKRNMHFYDSKKISKKMWIHLYDSVKDGPMPIYTDVPCMWCREQFITCPLGIPVKYVPRDSISREMREMRKKCKALNIRVDDNFEFFETDGIFCSFPCVKSQIREESSNPRYKNAFTNLTLLHYKLFGECKAIPFAPSYKLLKKWGGHLTIDQYRSSFDRVIYEDTINVMPPIMFPIGTLHEEIKVN